MIELFEKYNKKQTYEFCRIRKEMVRLDIIKSTLISPDLVNTEAKLVPVECNRSKDCKKQGINCMVYVENGADPCPEAWNCG